MVVIFPTDLGDGEAPGRALDQPDAEAFFQKPDAAAQPGPGHTEFAGCGGEPILLYHPSEEAQIIEVLHSRLSYF